MPDDKELEDALMDVVRQGCWYSNRRLDSGNLICYAEALRVLAQRGRVRIFSDDGRSSVEAVEV